MMFSGSRSDLSLRATSQFVPMIFGSDPSRLEHQRACAHGIRHLLYFCSDAHHVLRVLLVPVVPGEDILLLLLRLTMAWRGYPVKMGLMRRLPWMK